MVRIKDSYRPFPNVPKSLGALIFTWFIVLGILYFDYQSGQQTNPLIVYSIPLLYMFALMPKDSWKSIKEALGIAAPTLRDKFVTLVSAIAGLSLGIGLYNVVTRQASIIPLYFPPFLATLEPSGIIILMTVVGVWEEFYVILFSKTAGNWLYDKFGIRGISGMFGGMVIGRVFWSTLHLFSYGVSMSTAPLFFVAWGLGVIMSTLAIGMGVITGKKYLTIAAIVAHASYNIMIGLFIIMFLV